MSSEVLSKKLQTVDFGRFLFIYLLGRNVDYFSYKRILDFMVEEERNNEEGNSVQRCLKTRLT